MSHSYPQDEDALYYVEFERGDHKGEFTLFKRQWCHTAKELAKIELDNPDGPTLLRTEFHPWNLFTTTYGPPGSVPDETWVKFMVDALNAAVKEAAAEKNREALYKSWNQDASFTP